LAEAEKLAVLLANAPSTADFPVPPPMFLTGPLLAAAARVWKDASAHLEKLNLLSSTDGWMLAAFCVYVAEFVQANEEVMAKGYSVEVRTISGDKMPRTNPAVSRRDDAFKYMAELSKCFGFTPRHMYELTKLQKGSDGPLFDIRPAPQVAEAEQIDPATAKWNRLLDDPLSTPPKPN